MDAIAFTGFEDDYNDPDLPSPPSPPPVQEEPAPLGRGHRIRFPSKKVRDAMPEGPGELQDVALEPAVEPEPAAAGTATGIRRVVLRVTEIVKTAVNGFGLSRKYYGRPTSVPDTTFSLDDVLVPVVPSRRGPLPSIDKIIAPYPNITAWRFDFHEFVRGDSKSRNDMKRLRKEVIGAPDFNQDHAVEESFESYRKKLVDGPDMPWAGSPGWSTERVSIRIPTGEKRTKEFQREAARQQRMRESHESSADPLDSVPGILFASPDLHVRSIIQVMIDTFQNDAGTKQFHFHPYEQYYSPPGSDAPPQRVYDDLYSSQAWIDEDIKLQHSPREEDCSLPRIIAALMFWSDATHVSTFGQAKMWPLYMCFGNQPKDLREKSGSNAMRHLAYLPSVSLVARF